MHVARPVPPELPGAEIVSEGLADLAAARDSVTANVVAMGSARLRAAGIDVPAESRPRPASHRL